MSRRILRAVLGVYMRPYHRLEMRNRELLPPYGGMLIVVNHASLLDVPALMVLDPYPDTRTIVKAELFKVPGLALLLGQWGAIPVERQGRDTASVRRLLGVLRAGQPLAVAAEGRRTRSGHLEDINPVLARIAAGSGVPIVPVGIGGSFAALPPGAILPRPVQIVATIGEPWVFPRGTTGEEAAARIKAAIAKVLPPDMQPVD